MGVVPPASRATLGETLMPQRERLAVIGAGVSGLTAAYLLQRRYDVTLFEAEDRLGGHAHTHRVITPKGDELAVDSGFIVFNNVTYPHLTRLLDEIGIDSVQDAHGHVGPLRRLRPRVRGRARSGRAVRQPSDVGSATFCPDVGRGGAVPA